MRKTQDFFKVKTLKEVKSLWFWTVAILLILLNPITDLSVSALTLATIIIRPHSSRQATCPTDLQSLLDKMLLDLPSYTNRVIQRGITGRAFEKDIYILIARQLNELESLPFDVNLENSSETSLVYFQTWERKHYPNKILRFQRYHWLFLRQTETGWVLEKMFSKSSSYPRYGLYPVPGETSNSAIAQGIRLWLRDCQAR